MVTRLTPLFTHASKGSSNPGSAKQRQADDEWALGQKECAYVTYNLITPNRNFYRQRPGRTGPEHYGRGWNAERIAAAGELVEACAVANTSQKQKVQAYRAEAGVAQQAETALRQWYSQAARLSKIAIKRSDPANLEQLHGLLGL